METQKTPNNQSNLEKETRSWRSEAPGLQTILQSYSNQDSPEINPCTYGHLMFDEARIYNGEKTACSISGAGKTGQLHGKE